MPIFVFWVVMSAALLHATWNAIVKSAADKFFTTILVATSSAIISAVLLPFLAIPAAASWPYAAASAVFQVGYFLLLSRAYQIADMSQAYPLMRGTAPLLVAFVTVFQLGEPLSRVAWIGVIGICVGILTILVGSELNHRQGIYFALLNALVIAGYTLIDGAGVRLSGAPAAYTLWVFLLTGVPLAVWVCMRARTAFFQYVSRNWPRGIAGGIGTSSSYGLALWAMTMAPVPVVAALRETSIVFATLIAGLVLKEPIGVRRVVSACVIACSAAILRAA